MINKSEKKVFLKNFGCQMNVRDSEIVRGILEECKYQFVDDESHADIVIFNTCSVREHAEHRAISVLGSLIKKDKKRAKVFGLIGCVAKHKKEELFKSLPGLNFICGPAEIYEIGDILRDVTGNRYHVIRLSEKQRPIDNVNPAYRESKTHAFVNIAYGCNNYCSYCIVPYARGPEVSRPVEDIAQEVSDLAKRGISHVTLLGQNVNSYSDHRPQTTDHRLKNKKYDFVCLLKVVHEIEGIKKISFVTSHPKDAGVRLFKTIAEFPKIDRYLHLPLQSGSNRILRLMHRGYTIEKYHKLIADYRKIVPEAKLSTDIIVGFPSESEEDFIMTKKAVEEVRFNNAYIFKYSPRPPAKSSELPDDVPPEVKEKRHNILLDLQKKISLNKI
jgi:tRNA-2-methylthio-N6-dimethylallyladenosine synthase